MKHLLILSIRRLNPLGHRRQLSIGLYAGVAILITGITLSFVHTSGKAIAYSNLVTVEDTSAGTNINQFEYHGSWTTCAGCQPATANASYHQTSTNGATATLRFNGTQVNLYGVKSPTGGIATITLDGGAPANFDSYAPLSAAALVYSTPNIAPGAHTMVITNTTSQNAASTGTQLSIDRADIAPTPTAILYGKTGTFGGLSTNLPTGESLYTDAVTGWGFAPGDSEFFSALAPTGDVVLGTNPQTDDEHYATADHMNIGIFNPTSNVFRNLTIPTSTGSLVTTNPFYPVGGASVDGLVSVNVGGVPRIAFTSSVPYNGWDLTKYGEYPSLGYLDATTGSLAYNQSMSVSANQIHNKGGLSTNACFPATNIFGQSIASCRGLAEMQVLPLSQKFVITQYLQDIWNGNQQSGRIVVMNTDASVVASYTYPNIPNPAGGFYSVNPREVDVDPTSTGNLEYFTVVFDVVDRGAQGTGTMQEFAYNRTTNQITPVSLPILSGQTGTNGQRYRYDTAQYDSSGNLWLTQAVTGQLTGGPAVVYAKSSGKRALETRCAAPAGWTGVNGANWATSCAPDKTALGTGDYGQSRSLVEDPATHMMFDATINGYLLRVKQTGTGSGMTLTTMPAINLGLDTLADRTKLYIGVRKGIVDVKNRALWLPVVQVANPSLCPTWPSTQPCTPVPLDQWLYRFDLSALSS
jgi:hypothetical protein